MSGVSFKSTIIFDEKKIIKAEEEKKQFAQKALDSVVLQDSNFYCPLKTSALQKSAINNTRIGSGEIIWKTPYARRQYYEYVRPFYQPNPNACAKWFEAAKAKYIDKWINLVNERIKRK
ncbi:MAG: minor capsid protein [Clostridia bacterium]|nr:minor capsid protein [Clostridia bacterium]